MRFNRATPQPKRSVGDSTWESLHSQTDVANLLGAQGISTFSFAHEYAHVLLDRELKAILSHARDRSSLMEVRANAFAASFLMPAEGVRGYVNALSKGLGSRTRADTFDEEAVTRVEGRKRVDTQNIELHDVVRMAHHFGVSCTAMLYRLKGLDFVTEDERSSLAAQDSAGLAKVSGDPLVFRSRSIPTARCESMPGSWRWRSRHSRAARLRSASSMSWEVWSRYRI